MSDTTPARFVETAAKLGPQIRACADEIEQSRRLPLSLVEAMAEAGLFRLWIPRSLGGEEADPMTLVRVVEEVSRVDGAAGWCMAIGGTYGVFGGYLPPTAAQKIYGSDKEVRTAGAFRPMGEAVVVDGGYRATGRWPLGSGCQHSAWIVGGCRILDGDRPRLRADGSPVTRILFFPAADCEILDTSHSIGLRGTGSHDYAVSDVFVPSARSLRSAIPRASLARFTVCRRSRCSQPDWRRCRSGSPGMRSTSCWSWRKPRSLAARGGRCARMRRCTRTSARPRRCCAPGGRFCTRPSPRRGGSPALASR